MSCKSVFSESVADFFKGSFKKDFLAKLKAKGVAQEVIDKYEAELPDDIIKSEDISKAVEDAK